ncbi:MAG: zf-HC2 domain-containing protein [Acidobacteriota bacterium]|nr:zf-HC2 domain-containing protein [Acidobacteriota bacterium]
MNCIETKRNIEALLDNELDDELKDKVEHHLWACSMCRKLREQTASLSCLLQVSRAALPAADFDKRMMKSFRRHHAAASQSWWRRVVFGSLVVPKPAFATLLILVLAGLWLAFQIGKISSSTVSMTAPFINTNEIFIPAETTIQTVMVEVPVIKEKTVTRMIYVREQRNNKNEKNEKNKSSADSQQNNLPLYSSTVADNGYFTDVSLKGFQPSAEINAKIIKEVKEDEK